MHINKEQDHIKKIQEEKKKYQKYLDELPDLLLQIQKTPKEDRYLAKRFTLYPHRFVEEIKRLNKDVGNEIEALEKMPHVGSKGLRELDQICNIFQIPLTKIILEDIGVVIHTTQDQIKSVAEKITNEASYNQEEKDCIYAAVNFFINYRSMLHGDKLLQLQEFLSGKIKLQDADQITTEEKNHINNIVAIAAKAKDGKKFLHSIIHKIMRTDGEVFALFKQNQEKLWEIFHLKYPNEIFHELAIPNLKNILGSENILHLSKVVNENFLEQYQIVLEEKSIIFHCLGLLKIKASFEAKKKIYHFLRYKNCNDFCFNNLLLEQEKKEKNEKERKEYTRLSIMCATIFFIMVTVLTIAFRWN